MESIIQVAGREHTLQLFGIPLAGVSATNAKKLVAAVFSSGPGRKLIQPLLFAVNRAGFHLVQQPNGTDLGGVCHCRPGGGARTRDHGGSGLLDFSAVLQYTGRIVTITNDKIFDQPVYNYMREFLYIWDEMHLPIPYNADRNVAE